ncbi:putative Ig domain-containing protein [Pseudosporangium ferrugineum]|uniref:Type II secretory pathway pseudopilin PulG n=1 Tax=Pseudosporangium ferrugineum TaxID=439699 RepID=A0A2T0S3A7_9ACTN|nr:putative Ig domain-containing protein [Pseudosporangium ferrugineum]PRY27908.1 type II secretory pathway pseudopilin PulG [Pseudosporangium ferrugineum]
MATVRTGTAAPPGDEGLSLLEVLMSIVVIGTVMASVAPFLVRSLNVSDQQRGDQIAVQVANDALERVRGLDPTSLLTGRSKAATDAQWSKAPAEVKDLLPAGLAADPMLPVTSTAGLRAPLPTEENPFPVNDMTFKQQWYVGRCWQPKADATHTDIGACGGTATGVPFFRVVVSVTWKHRACTSGNCIYVASTLVSNAADPVFDIKRPAPTVTDPGNQYAYLGSPVNLQIGSTGGRLPLTWTATGLPAGLTLSPTALVTGTPTALGTSTVVVKVTDKDGRTDDSTFTWTVVNELVLTNPGDQLTRPSTAVSLTVAATGGVTPRAWSATGLPASMTINPTTGVISGTTPAAIQTLNVTVTVKDGGTRTLTVAFVWRIAPPLVLPNPGNQSATIGDNGDYPLAASGGAPPYAWTAANLPAGLTINPTTGRVSGILTQGTRYITTITVTDSMGIKQTVSVVISVANRTGSDLRITAPNPASPNQTTALGATVSLTATGLGANKPSYQWTATGLPPGVALAPDGVFSGKPTAKGVHRVTLTLTSDQSVATMMFDWTVT